MSVHVTNDTVNILYERYHSNWSKASLYYHAIEHIRETLIILLASRGNAFICKVDDVFLDTRNGLAYRAAYIKSIRVTEITETRNYDTTLESWKTIKHRKDHFSMNLQIRFMEFYQEIMDPEFVGTEMPPTSLLKQAMLLEEAASAYWDSKKSDKIYQPLPLHVPEMMDIYGLGDADDAISRGLGRKILMDYRKYKKLGIKNSRQCQPQGGQSYSSNCASCSTCSSAKARVCV